MAELKNRCKNCSSQFYDGCYKVYEAYSDALIATSDMIQAEIGEKLEISKGLDLNSRHHSKLVNDLVELLANHGCCLRPVEIEQNIALVNEQKQNPPNLNS